MQPDHQPDQLDFTTDWLSHNVPTWTRILASLDLLETDRPLRALEVGSWEGRSACWLLQHVCRAPGSLLVCIDTWRGFQHYAGVRGQYGLSATTHSAEAVEARFDRNIAALGAAGRLHKLKGTSQQLLRGLRDAYEGQLQLVYIDGSHVPEDIAADGEAAWPLLASGGLLIFDDYAWHEVVELAPGQRPKEAIDAFLERHAEELIVLDLAYQCIVQKTGPGGLLCDGSVPR